MITEPATETVATLPVPSPTELLPSRRGRRLRAAVRALIVSLAVAGLVAVTCPGLFGTWSTRTSNALPSSIELPWHWQASVAEDPPGPAAVVATVDDQGGATDMLAAIAAGDAIAPVAVVGRSGAYRALYPSGGPWRAGENLHLSPDGRYLALPYLNEEQARQGPTIVDLTTGEARVVAAGLTEQQGLAVLGWRPDGAALLLAITDRGTARVALLDLATGSLTRLAERPAPADPGEWRAAFSPDGSLVSFAIGGWLYLVGSRGEALWAVPLDGAQLAGAGAFTPDGTRIALVHALPCDDSCAGAPSWSVTYVDTTDGTAARGPVLPTIAASGVRAVGWAPHEDGSASLILVRYLPPPPPQPVQGPDGELTLPADASIVDDDGSSHADLYELAPAEPARLLLDAPYEVTDLDVAAELVWAGRFEGEPSMPSLLPIEPGRLRPIDVVVAVAVAGGLAVVVGVVVSLTGRSSQLPRLLARVRPRRR